MNWLRIWTFFKYFRASQAGHTNVIKESLRTGPGARLSHIILILAEIKIGWYEFIICSFCSIFLFADSFMQNGCKTLQNHTMYSQFDTVGSALLSTPVCGFLLNYLVLRIRYISVSGYK